MNIIGNSSVQEYLQKVIENKSFAHAYVFSGPQHIGKTTFAEWFINNIICDERCEIHLEEKHNQIYPDFYFLEREEGKKDISVEQVRKLIGSLQMTSLLGNYKVAVINGAEYLNSASSNALLKALEEPTSKTLLILLTSNEEHLLQTIRSRSVIIRLQSVSREEMTRYASPNALL